MADGHHDQTIRAGPSNQPDLWPADPIQVSPAQQHVLVIAERLRCYQAQVRDRDAALANDLGHELRLAAAARERRGPHAAITAAELPESGCASQAPGCRRYDWTFNPRTSRAARS